MTQADEPHLQPVAIASLRPTQMTVGFREVACKRLEWREIAGHDGPDFLGRHMVPVVIGWKKHAYLIDHHHLVRAVLEEGVAHVLTSVVADLSDLAKPEFWSVMDHYAGPIRSMPQASASRTPTCPNPWAGLPTIPSGHWPAHFAARVVMPRTIRRSARSCGPISSETASIRNYYTETSRAPKSRPSNLHKPSPPGICRVGAAQATDLSQ